MVKIKGQVFQVGGSVRDTLLGLPVSDQDFVVVGATMEDMTSEGFTQVGKDFPVFLHPLTHDEYALARTERKTGSGHTGFKVAFGPDVTLEQDLERRDLTINAMAMSNDGQLIDPYHGAQDLRLGVLRHVSEAFAEDPLRVFRVARFAGRFGFSVDPITMAMMRRLHDTGETDRLTNERIWKETSRALMGEHASRYWDVLQAVGTGQTWFVGMPGWNANRDRGFRADAAHLDQDLQGTSLETRIARWSLHTDVAFSPVDDRIASMWQQVKASAEVVDRVRLTQILWRRLGSAPEERVQRPSTLWRNLALEHDVLRRPQRWLDALDDVRDHGLFSGRPTGWIPDRGTLEGWTNVLRIDAAAVAKSGPSATIQERVAQARHAAWEGLASSFREASLSSAEAFDDLLEVQPSKTASTGLLNDAIPFAPRPRRR